MPDQEVAAAPLVRILKPGVDELHEDVEAVLVEPLHRALDLGHLDPHEDPNCQVPGSLLHARVLDAGGGAREEELKGVHMLVGAEEGSDLVSVQHAGRVLYVLFLLIVVLIVQVYIHCPERSVNVVCFR